MNKEQKIGQILSHYWGYDAFRLKQKEIILSSLNNLNTLAILPTGGGKSICYQIPGLYMSGKTLVISPLIALMEDQKNQLLKRGIKAISITGKLSNREQDILFDNIAYGDEKFIFMSPERINSPYFKNRLQKMNISLLAIDEAHCISEWGHDFRPQYRLLGQLREDLKEVPCICLTATATPRVTKDIIDSINLTQCNVFKSSPVRENLGYFTIKTENKLRQIKGQLEKENPAIVYVNRRRKAIELSKYFNEFGLQSKAFHGGMEIEYRNQIIDEWNNDKLKIIVATKAFGMGMDKSNVRAVHHYSVSDSLEAYVQEAGRAGRDNSYARALLYWHEEDLNELKQHVEIQFPKAKIVKMVYAKLVSYFQMATGENLDKWLGLDLAAFSQYCRLSKYVINSSLILLSKSGYVTLSDDIIHPSRVLLFNDQINQLLKDKLISEKVKQFVKFLLRNHDGIMIEPRRINEELIGKKLKLKTNQIIEALKWLEKRDYISYDQKFNGHRISFGNQIYSPQNISLDPQSYDLMKKRALNNIKSIEDYLKTPYCKQQYIAQYFGFKNEKECGKCDYCELRKPKKYINRENVISLISLSDKTLDDLVKSFTFKEKNEVYQLIRELEDEEIIKIIGDKIHYVK